jgi:hypothetical protein
VDTSIIGLIVIAAIAAVLVVAVIAWVVLTKRHQDRHDADTIGEDARRETLTVRQQEALADETFAKGRRAAQAEAEADAAHALRLQRQLGGNRVEAPTSHQHLNGQRDIADVMSPLPDTRNTEI